MGMGKRVMAQWAKEEVLSAIDAHFTELAESVMHPDFDEELALLTQRNRIARFFGLPERGPY